MANLGRLICGDGLSSGVANTALGQLSESLNRFSAKALFFLESESEETKDDLINFGPFCARILLENSCAAITGRIDCFRMIYLSEFQGQPEYEIGKRARSAFSWTGDVMPEEKSANTLWNIDHETSKISRAMFSKHCEHLYWKPALTCALDFLATQTNNKHTQDLLQLESENFITQFKGRSSQLYSTLSKSVHWEYFSSTLMFDETTIKSLIKDSLTLLSNVGFISHFIPTAHSSLAYTEALDEFTNLRNKINE